MCERDLAFIVFRHFLKIGIYTYSMILQNHQSVATGLAHLL